VDHDSWNSHWRKSSSRVHHLLCSYESAARCQSHAQHDLQCEKLLSDNIPASRVTKVQTIKLQCFALSYSDIKRKTTSKHDSGNLDGHRMRLSFPTERPERVTSQESPLTCVSFRHTSSSASQPSLVARSTSKFLPTKQSRNAKNAALGHRESIQIC